VTALHTTLVAARDLPVWLSHHTQRQSLPYAFNNVPAIPSRAAVLAALRFKTNRPSQVTTVQLLPESSAACT
jgi:hypothetical protein